MESRCANFSARNWSRNSKTGRRAEVPSRTATTPRPIAWRPSAPHGLGTLPVIGQFVPEGSFLIERGGFVLDEFDIVAGLRQLLASRVADSTLGAVASLRLTGHGGFRIIVGLGRIKSRRDIAETRIRELSSRKPAKGRRPGGVQHFPKAGIGFDKFHLIGPATRAAGRARRLERLERAKATDFPASRISRRLDRRIRHSRAEAVPGSGATAPCGRRRGTADYSRRSRSLRKSQSQIPESASSSRASGSRKRKSKQPQQIAPCQPFASPCSPRRDRFSSPP